MVMSGSQAPDGLARTSAIDGRAGRTPDWRAIERSEEFKELVRRRRAFVVPASVAFFGIFLAYLLLATFAEGFMGSQIVDGLPVAWVLAACQVFMTWIVTWLYLRKSDNEWEPLERRAAALAEEVVATADAGGRGAREEVKVK
jgi:uncharacterized membrane protein (DUF485 family)